MELLNGPYSGIHDFKTDQDLFRTFGVKSQDFGRLLIQIVNATDSKVREFDTSNFGSVKEIYNFLFNETLQIDAKNLGPNRPEKAIYTIKNTKNRLSLSVSEALIQNLMLGIFNNVDFFHMQKVLQIGKCQGEI